MRHVDIFFFGFNLFLYEVMPQQSINGRKCYTCNDIDCSQKLYCEGEEDRCITATGEKNLDEPLCLTFSLNVFF